MELSIGENIKKLRKEKGFTQERLAELLNVSCAAVSKWESRDSYPDITMIFPLAHLFGVSVDELTGYNAARIEAEIEFALSEHMRLKSEGKLEEAVELIIGAYKKHPADYRVMSRYMWEIAGGSADNNAEVLLAHRAEFLRICERILEGCPDEPLRFEAMTMKAKLLHAAGDTESALAVLAAFPSWYQSAEQKTEQLFAKDTPEFRARVRQNLYQLAHFTANKLIKSLWYEENSVLSDRTRRGEDAGDGFAALYAQTAENAFAVLAHAAYAELAGKLLCGGGKTEDIIRIRGKAFESALILSAQSERDGILREVTAHTRPAQTANWLKTTSLESLALLRQNPEYMDMLNKYSAL